MTNMIPAGEQVLKTDAKGRVRTPPQRREELLDEFERSGLSGKKFAQLVGVKYQTFATWTHKRRQRALVPALKPGDPVRWLEAVVGDSSNPGQGGKSGLLLRLPGQGTIQITELSQVELAAALLRVLDKPLATPC